MMPNDRSAKCPGVKGTRISRTCARYRTTFSGNEQLIPFQHWGTPVFTGLYWMAGFLEGNMMKPISHFKNYRIQPTILNLSNEPDQINRSASWHGHHGMRNCSNRKTTQVPDLYGSCAPTEILA